MSRQTGSNNFAGTLEILAGGPIDARLVVPTKADLTVSANFPYPYVGMIVSVSGEGKAYILTATPVTDEDNWDEVGSGGSSVPSGGTTGQALVKRSATDGDVEWGNIIPASAKGTASGVAELDSNGKVPASQLPSYVDDVVEGYYKAANDRFYEESTFTTLIPPESGKSWVDIAGNKSYRWSGSAYVRVDEGVQLGETSDTAYRGDRGKTAYDFSQTPYTSTPAMDGTGSAGSSNAWAKGDHVHPKDTTKADKVSGATSGHLAALNSSGNLTDSGKALSDLQAKLTAGDGITINPSTNTISADVNYLIGAYDIYDTTERHIGYYKGKPLYRKCFSCGALTDATAEATTTKQAIGASVDEFVKCIGILRSSADSWSTTIPYTEPYANPQYFVFAGLYPNAAPTSAYKNTVCLYYRGSLSWIGTTNLIVEYTKTTDSASSVSYGHENQYSTSEQIVGTWIDGKPLYQKTIQTTTPSAETNWLSNWVDVRTLSIDKAISVSGILIANGLYENVPIAWAGGEFVALGCAGGYIALGMKGSNFVSQTIYVTLQYTKTT